LKAPPPSPGLVRLPNGCFTIDGACRIVASTLPHSFPAETVRQIGQVVLDAFRTAQEAQLVFKELHIQYPALKLTARQLRGGAIVFLAPQSPS
jgi:hypothetical protein